MIQQKWFLTQKQSPLDEPNLHPLYCLVCVSSQALKTITRQHSVLDDFLCAKYQLIYGSSHINHKLVHNCLKAT